MSLNAGALLADRYRLGSRIATGGMGEVWQATDTRLNRQVALKVLKPEVSADPEFLERFRVEARTAAALNHPGIAGVYDYGETETLDDGARQTAYLVMELVDGEPLSAVLAREGRLDLDHVLDMLEQTGRALQAAHARGTVHRDIKPGNILITPSGQVKITDFGIAKAADAAPVTRTGMVVGTAQYISPEQALGREATPASDVYSLGVVGYEAVSGRRPFTAENPVSVAMMHVREDAPPLPTDVPPNVRRLLEWAMAKDPAQRYATGGQFADAVAAVRAGRRPPPPAGWAGGSTATMPVTPPQLMGPAPIPARPARYDEPLPQRRSNKAIWWLVGFLAVALLALGGYALLSSGGSPQPTTPVTPTTAPTAPTVSTQPPTTTVAPTTQAPTTTRSTAPPTTTTPQPTTTTTTPPTTTTRPTTTSAPPTTSSAPPVTSAPGGSASAATTGLTTTATATAPGSATPQ